MIHYKQGKRTAEDAIEELRAIARSPQAGAIMRQIQRDALSLQSAMREIHGGRWSIDINHRSCFVLVARDGDC